MSDKVISNTENGDVVMATGPYPGTPLLRVPASGVFTDGGPGSIIYALSITPPNDGAGYLGPFAFDPPIGTLLCAFIGGVVQNPDTVGLDDSGITFNSIVPPAEVVGAIFIRR
jgi:hypothetical protein